jgi:hypothetical protein
MYVVNGCFVHAVGEFRFGEVWRVTRIWGCFAANTHGAKKDGLVNKIKEKLPGQHNTATGAGAADPNAPPKKGMMEKIKEKLPGHHGTSNPDV